ncbi:MAG: protein kinase, partial [Chloroflexales bacterium]|nr:protein kinase [Chloroflexales bacterium]
MDEPDSFGSWIRRRRKAQDLTREVLAAQVGCAVVTIRKIEADERRPSRQIAERLALALAIPTEDHEAFLRAARAELAVSRLTPPPTPTAPPLPLPNAAPVLRGYHLHEQIGTGGFGAVYRATQPGVHREVAIKVITPERANQPEFIRRFEAEARLVARLEHPHIVPLYDYWREPAGAYLVMRYMRGGSVQAALTAPWPLERCTRLLDEVGPALAFAHRQGVIHRDLKPANLLLDADGAVYLADFGIAKEFSAMRSEDMTQPDAVVGSPEYLSPEQLRDEPLTPATDIYGLGLLLYVLLAGAHPLRGLPPAERLARQLTTPLPPLAGVHPELPNAIEAVLQRATAKAPATRYQDVAALAASWRQALGTTPGSPTVPETTPPGYEAVVADDVPTETATIIENPYKGLRAFSEADATDFFE